jgi:HTH-type transcriptional regulator/antitoxin HigA
MKMNVRPIKTEADYDWALKEIARYFDVQPKPGTAEGARFVVLATLIEAYEDKHWPIDLPGPWMPSSTEWSKQGWVRPI